MTSALTGYVGAIGGYLSEPRHETLFSVLVFDKNCRAILGAAGPKPFTYEEIKELCDSTAEGTSSESYTPRIRQSFASPEHAMNYLIDDGSFGSYLFSGPLAIKREGLFWYIDRETDTCSVSIAECEDLFAHRELIADCACSEECMCTDETEGDNPVELQDEREDRLFFKASYTILRNRWLKQELRHMGYLEPRPSTLKRWLSAAIKARETPDHA